MAADCLPIEIPFYPIFYICNSDEWYKRGSHWLLLMFRSPDEPPEYFDSFGHTPDYYNKLIKDYLIVTGGTGGYMMSTQQVQPSYSWHCGYYCLTVADYFSQGYSLSNITTLFDEFNLPKNDQLVRDYVNSHMRRL